MKRLFEVVIGTDDDGIYFAILSSLTDNKHAVVKDKDIRRVLSKVSKLVRKKAEQFRAFPLPEVVPPEPSRIITPNGKPHALPEIARG